LFVSGVPKKVSEFDVVVFGYDAAGLVTLIEAVEHGAFIAMIEKIDRPIGNAICGSAELRSIKGRRSRLSVSNRLSAMPLDQGLQTAVPPGHCLLSQNVA
jgi:hypothetical protein